MSQTGNKFDSKAKLDNTATSPTENSLPELSRELGSLAGKRLAMVQSTENSNARSHESHTGKQGRNFCQLHLHPVFTASATYLPRYLAKAYGSIQTRINGDRIHCRRSDLLLRTEQRSHKTGRLPAAMKQKSWPDNIAKWAE